MTSGKNYQNLTKNKNKQMNRMTEGLTSHNQKPQTQSASMNDKNKQMNRMTGGLTARNQKLQTQNVSLKDEIKKMKKMTEGLTEDNQKLQTQNVNLSMENKKLKTENEKLLLENAKLKTETTNDIKAETEDQSPEGAVPLNSNWNSLSLGTEMYESLFSCKVDTPQVWIDPLVWNIFYAAVPSEYSIPDSKFVNILSTNVARELLKPAFTSDQSLKLNSFLDKLTHNSKN